MKESICNYLEDLKCEIVLLDDCAGKGKTIIEKFECNSNVEKAIVLLSGDDELKPYGARKDSKRKVARQNVVFEFGYFVAKIGRENVIQIIDKKDTVKLLSDIAGSEYITFDKNGNWKRKLKKEII